MSTVTLTIPEKTLEALVKLAEVTGVKEAEVTGVKEKEALPKLIQDALRVYEWVLFQQAEKGRVITALTTDDLKSLAENPALHGDRECLKPLFDKEKEKEARGYFKKAA